MTCASIDKNGDSYNFGLVLNRNFIDPLSNNKTIVNMRLKDLEAVLQAMEPFDTSVQKVDLEQYSTDAHLASRLIYTAATGYDDIEGKTVVDLGTGTAMLGKREGELVCTVACVYIIIHEQKREGEGSLQHSRA